MQLEKGQRNGIFDAIETAGLNPRDFELDTGGNDDDEARIIHRRSESTFVLGRDGMGGYSGTMVAGDGRPWPYRAHSWTSAEQSVSRWLEEVKQDLETPDLWAELQQEREMLGTAPAEATENTPFSADEQREIANQLRATKKYVKKTYALSEDDMQALEARLDHLGDAAGRLGRLDWRTVVAGTLLTAIVEAVLPPEATRDVLLMLLRSLAHLFGHPIPELPSA
jgi:hypothetical protein